MTRHRDRVRRHGRTALLILAALFLGGIALLWGWNSFAVEILSQPPVKFRHALALEAAILAAVGMVPLLRRITARPAS